MNKAFYRHNSPWIKLVFSDGSTYLQTNSEQNRKALLRDGFELILLNN
jgi:hypothetical protein